MWTPMANRIGASIWAVQAPWTVDISRRSRCQAMTCPPRPRALPIGGILEGRGPQIRRPRSARRTLPCPGRRTASDGDDVSSRVPSSAVTSSARRPRTELKPAPVGVGVADGGLGEDLHGSATVALRSGPYRTTTAEMTFLPPNYLTKITLRSFRFLCRYRNSFVPVARYPSQIPGFRWQEERRGPPPLNGSHELLC